MAFIIAPISVVWLFITLVSAVFTADEKTADTDEITNYIEKIGNFALQEFNDKHQLTHFVEAKNYFNFEQEPALLIEPKIIVYNEKGERAYIMTSKRANYLDNGEIKFKDKVDINVSTGAAYKINTKELLVNTKTNNLTSQEDIIYLDEHATVAAQGMTMQVAEDKMQLIGKISISQDSGQTILTRDLSIDQSNSQKHYYAKSNTTYLASDNKIYSQGIDMDMRKGLVTLLGKVKILQKSGTTIDTKALIIKQSNNNEVYQTKEKVHYQSKVANIHATGMRYDTKAQTIKLTGGVAGRYE
ncbi:MAG: LPS export ABC transporter periplasmic protein LptC [Gammaproteobacteria bacterium]|nr:LPS export ABC transporter periplasmic protein LptC [Gammaproteobacteria bacterium]